MLSSVMHFFMSFSYYVSTFLHDPFLFHVSDLLELPGEFENNMISIQNGEYVKFFSSDV